jgi:hypothetical protein
MSGKDEEKGSQGPGGQQDMSRLAFCVVGVVGSLLAYGVLQVTYQHV